MSLNKCLNQNQAPALQYLLLADDAFASGRGLAPELSDYFRLPKRMLSDVYRRSNGFFSFETALDQHGHSQCYYSFLRLLVKHVPGTGTFNYAWHEMTFLSRWDTERYTVLCVGADATFQKTLRGILSDDWSRLLPIKPFLLHVPIIETILTMQDASVWSIRDIVRSVEKDRHRGIRDFTMLHETARHAIHSYETLGVTVETLEALQQQQRELIPNEHGDEGQDTVHLIRSEIDSQVRMLRNLLRRSQSNQERLQNEISLAYNMIAQRDSQAMTRLGEASKLDSGAMRTIAVVTMAFLPPTFISAVFSMSFFNYSPAQDGRASAWTVSDKFWVYWVFAVPMTGVTMALWFWQQRRMGGV